MAPTHSTDMMFLSEPCTRGPVTFKGHCPRLRSGLSVFIRRVEVEPNSAIKERKMRFILVRNGVLGVALAGLMTAGAAQAQNKDATKDAAQAQKDVAKDAKVKKDKDRDPNPDNDKNKGKHKGEVKGKHKAIGHSH